MDGSVASVVIDLTNEPEERAEPRATSRTELPEPSGLAASAAEGQQRVAQGPCLAGCRIFLLDVSSVQKEVFRKRIPQFGGQVADVVDSSVTQIVTTCSSFEAAMERLKQLKAIVVDLDEHRRPKPIRCNVHGVEWLSHALGTKMRPKNDFHRLERNAAVAEPPSASRAVSSGAVSSAPVAAVTSTPAPASVDVVFSAALIPQTPVYYCNDRPLPPCNCGLVAACVANRAGRLCFRCPRFGRDDVPKCCLFFEWVDEKPRREWFSHFSECGYDFKPFLDLPRIPFVDKQPLEEQRQPGKREPPAEEEGPLKYVDESSIPSVCKCCICLVPMTDPRTTVACGHSFCFLCIFAWLHQGRASTCPECRQPVSVDDGLRDPDPTLVYLLGRLLVWCPHKDCDWQGERSKLDKHKEICQKKGRVASAPAVAAASNRSKSSSSSSSSSDEVGTRKRPRPKLDPTVPPAILRASSKDGGPLLDVAGRVIVADDSVVNINGGHLYRRDEMLDQVKNLEDDEEDAEPKEVDDADNDDAMAHSPPTPSKFGRDTRVFSQFTPPSSEDENFQFDDDAARDPRFQYMSKDDVKISAHMERAKKKFAAANPNEFEARKNLNKELTDQLSQVAASYPGNSFQRRAHTIAAANISRLTYRIESVDQARLVPGVGAKILTKIGEFLAFGGMRKIRLKDESTKNREELSKVHGIGAKALDKLWTRGIRSVADLRQNTHLLSPNQLIGLKYLEEFQQRIPRAEVAEIEAAVIQVAHSIDPRLVLVTCGSYRRGKATSGDVDILITHEFHAKGLNFVLMELIEKLKANGVVTDELTTSKSGSDKWMGVCQLRPDLPHRRIDFQLIPRESWPFALLYFTGSEHFNRSMRLWAGKIGLSLSQHALVKRPTKKHVSGMYKMEGAVRVECNTEEDVFNALKLEYVPPNARYYVVENSFVCSQV